MGGQTGNVELVLKEATANLRMMERMERMERNKDELSVNH